MEDINSTQDTLKKAADYWRQMHSYYSRHAILTELDSVIHKLSEGTHERSSVEKTVLDVMKKIIINKAGESYCSEIWQYLKQHCSESVLVCECRKYIESPMKPLDNLEIKYQEKYGLRFFPKIVAYEEKKIGDGNLNSSLGDLSKNSFLLTLFSKIGIEISEISKAYQQFREAGNNIGFLKKLEKKINKKLNDVSTDFNRIYLGAENKYKLYISLDESGIYFYMNKGDVTLALDRQSTGFKWFFNLYFNLLCQKSLSPGDSILMDEPATNLHPNGQKELRSFLKDFSIRNDVTVVLATHSPFLVDLDNLDEIRVVTNGSDDDDSDYNGESSICNDFTTYDINDPNTLRPIKEALLVSDYVLVDPDATVVFVEGITDYNYLTAFKKKLEIEDNIVFLPIGGVGNAKSKDLKEKQKQLSQELIRLKKHNPILLVDGDKAGKSMYEINAKDSALTVITLSDIDEKFKVIESLFTEDEKRLFHINDKHSSTSSLFKNFIDSYTIANETLENFKKIFNRIKD